MHFNNQFSCAKDKPLNVPYVWRDMDKSTFAGKSTDETILNYAEMLIDVLRNWRDDFLEASYPGRAFIKAYYSLSPSVADNISESEGKRKIVRTTLGPIVKILKGRYSN